VNEKAFPGSGSHFVNPVLLAESATFGFAEWMIDRTKSVKMIVSSAPHHQYASSTAQIENSVLDV